MIVIHNPHLINILCCIAEVNDSICHGDLTETTTGIYCIRCGKKYIIDNNIIIMNNV